MYVATYVKVGLFKNEKAYVRTDSLCKVCLDDQYPTLCNHTMYFLIIYVNGDFLYIFILLSLLKGFCLSRSKGKIIKHN